MIEYPSFCYLENQKTGSTFVQDFLRQHCSEELVTRKKHAPITGAPVPGKYYFINVREPIALYRSLHTFGQSRKGEFFQRLHRAGQEHLYRPEPGAFTEWMRFVLATRNAPTLHPAYTPQLARMIGFMTWRFLRLACHDFQRLAPKARTPQELVQVIKDGFFMNAVLRQERLRKDLARVVRGPLAKSFADVDAAIAAIENAPQRNASKPPPVEASPPPQALLQRMYRKENFLYSRYYRNKLPDGNA